MSAESFGLASANAFEVRVAHNTVCHNATAIVGEGGESGNVLYGFSSLPYKTAQ